AAGNQKRLGREIDGGRKRHRRVGATHLLRNHTKLEMASARTAELLGDCDAEKTHFGETHPQLAVIGCLAVEHDPHCFRRAFFGEKFARLIAELLLVIGEVEIHGGLPFLLVDAVIPGWPEGPGPESITPSGGYGFPARGFL